MDVLRLHDAIVASCRSAAFDDVVELKVGVEVVLERLVSDESHTTESALELDSLEKFSLGQHRGSATGSGSKGTYWVSEAGLSKEGCVAFS